MAVKDNKKVADAQEQLLELLQDEDVKLKIFAREKAEFDRQTAMYHARKEGEMRGKKVGREEGIKEGKIEGEKESQRKIAQKLKERGMSVEEIAEITGLDKEEVEKL